MIYRLIDRSDTENKLVYYAAPYDGTNAAEVDALVRLGYSGAGVSPQLGVSGGQLKWVIGHDDVIVINVGEWIGPNGPATEQTVRSTYYLADDELHA